MNIKYKLIIYSKKELIIKYRITIGSILKDLPTYIKPKMASLQFIPDSVPYVRFLNLTAREFKELIDWVRISPYKDLFLTVFYLFKIVWFK